MTTTHDRAVMIGCFVASIGWQIYIVVSAFFKVPLFERMFSSMGAELPLITRALLLTYRGWLLVPIVCTSLAVFALRRRETSPATLGLLAFFCVASGFALQEWMIEGLWAPTLALMKAVG